MATQYAIFKSTGISPTNCDVKNGASENVSLALDSGTLPPAGSKIVSVSMYFSNVSIYSTHDPYIDFGSYGKMYFSSGTGANTTSLGKKTAWLSFTGGTIYGTVGSGSSATANVMNVRTGSYVTVTVGYEITSASTGSLTTTSVQQSGTIGLNISPADNSFSHSVLWYKSSTAYVEHTVSAGTTYDEFQIPSTWATGSAYAVLYTYSGNTLIGSNSYAFTVTVDPSTIIPSTGTLAVSLVQSAYVPSSWDVYVKGYSQALLSVANASAGSGGSFSSIAFVCGEQTKSTTNTKNWTTNALAETGTLQCQASVTNNYRNTATSNTVQITVYDYFDPVISTILAYRCLQDGTPNDNGTYLAVQAAVTIASVNSKNSLVSLQAQYKKASASSWSSGTALTSGATIIIGNGSLSGSETYQVRITAIDQVQNLRGASTTKTVNALNSESCIHCLNGGLNVSIGKEGSRQRAFEINGDWDVYHGDVRWEDIISIARGGTGATSAEAALNALGAAAASHTHSVSDLTDTLGVAKGGTGATNASTARSNLGITLANLGAAAASHNHDASDINAGTLAAARLPFKVQYGTTYITSSWTTVSLSGFTSAPCVVCTYAGDATTSGINVIKTKDISTNSFSVCTAGSNSTSRQICWIAIGT